MSQGINLSKNFRFLPRLPADRTKNLGRRQNCADRLGRMPFIMYRSLSQKQENLPTVLTEAKYNGQSRQEVKFGELAVYTLCLTHPYRKTHKRGTDKQCRPRSDATCGI